MRQLSNLFFCYFHSKREEITWFLFVFKGTYNGTTARSPLAAVATTSNGAITSTGTSETELLLAAVSSGHRGKRMLQCLFCGIEFPDQTLYFLHKGCHSESNPWKCNICGEQLNNVYEFNSHLLSKILTFSCFFFNNKSKLSTLTNENEIIKK